MSVVSCHVTLRTHELASSPFLNGSAADWQAALPTVLALLLKNGLQREPYVHIHVHHVYVTHAVHAVHNWARRGIMYTPHAIMA
jgi:hypothetical protein